MLLVSQIVIYLILSDCASAYFSGDNNIITLKRQEKFATYNNVKQTFLYSEVPESYGLLTGINDVRTSSYYSEKLNIYAASEILRNRNFIFESALKCFDGNQSRAKNHLKEVSIAAGAYVSNDEIFDREELMEGLEYLVSTKGTIAFVLGGKNNGKTSLLKRLNEKTKQKIINFDRHKDSYIPLHEMTEYATLIVDDANTVFSLDKLKETENLRGISKTLRDIIRLTKEELKINAVFATSDYSLPYQLNDPKFDCNILEICTIIYIGELSPKDIFELLTTKWGVHERLAIALISLYGGNIFQLHRALTHIQLSSIPTYTIDYACDISIEKCLSWQGDQSRMQETLQLLAEKGFAPLNSFQDPIGEIISLHNVGNIVFTNGLNVGVSQEIIGDATLGLVPSRQYMRLAIGKKLYEMLKSKPLKEKNIFGLFL